MLDWVDVLQTVHADPARASALAESLSSWAGNSREAMKSTRDRMARMSQSGQWGIFSHGYWGHEQMHLGPEANLVLFSHYLQSLEQQRKAAQIVAILGGKTPHIQNLSVGGVMNAIDLNGEGALGVDRLESIRVLMAEVSEFIHQVYFPDACMLAGNYPEWFDIGRGIDTYLAVPDLSRDTKGKQFDLPGGYIHGKSVGTAEHDSTFSDGQFREVVSEDVVHAYYRGDKALCIHGKGKPFPS
jgi:hydrogenase large subunit